MKLYISGPMTGYADKNHPAFREAAVKLVVAGYEVVDPSTLGEHDDWAWEQYLKRDLAEMLRCDGVALLNGWTVSRGAMLEVDVAERLGMPCRKVGAWVHDVPVPAVRP